MLGPPRARPFLTASDEMGWNLIMVTMSGVENFEFSAQSLRMVE